MKELLYTSAAALVLAACSPQEATQTAASSSVAGDSIESDRVVETSSRDDWGDFGLDLYSVNADVHPGDDFFNHVNGTWYDEFEIPSDQTRYGSFTLLREKSEQRVKFIIDDLAAEKPDPATQEGKVAAFYNAFVDTDAIEAAGMAPVQPYLDKINAIETQEDLARAFATVGFASPIGGGVSIDAKKTDENIFYISQSGLGLGDRSYYIKDDEKSQETRDGYVAFLTTVLGAAGYNDPADGAARILALETKIAEAHWDRTMNRNRDLTYNKLSKDEFTALGGSFPMAAFLDEIGVADQAFFVVSQVMPTEEEIEALQLTEDQLEKISAAVSQRLLRSCSPPIWQIGKPI